MTVVRGMPVQDRLLSEVVVTSTGCWAWTGRLTPDGYAPDIRIGKRRIKRYRASYEIYVGPIPPGFQIDHLCRNRTCINPAHLEAVTQQENIRRGLTGKINHRNSLKTHCKRGHPFTAANTYMRPNGGRNCRRCKVYK